VTGYGNECERMANGAGQSANGGRWRDRVSGEVAARPHPRGEEGPGRNEGTGPRGAGHRRRETPVPASGEEVGEKGHHYDRIIALYLEAYRKLSLKK
jgi:hypothetical protein